MTDHSKLPRLFVEAALSPDLAVALAAPQAHYLRNVLRRGDGDAVRLFNGHDGEWLAVLAATDRRAVAAVPREPLRTQPAAGIETELLFAPLKKDALDTLLQKATELGATRLRPVLTRNTEARRFNADRALAQVREAAEQCERLTVPDLAPLEPLEAALAARPADQTLYIALERAGAPALSPVADLKAAFLIGPEGGFTQAERHWLAALPGACPVSLGETILRAETASLYCLAARRLGLAGG